MDVLGQWFLVCLVLVLIRGLEGNPQPLPGFTDSEVNLNYSRLKDMSSAVQSGSQELLTLR